MSDTFAQPTSQDFLRQAQQASGKRQRLLLSLTRLQYLVEGPDLAISPRSILKEVITDLLPLLPEKRKA